MVERVYGSPGFDLPSADGAMMEIDCVSPSAVDEKDKIKGGMVLAKLKPISDNISDINGALICR